MLGRITSTTGVVNEKRAAGERMRQWDGHNCSQRLRVNLDRIHVLDAKGKSLYLILKPILCFNVFT